MAITIIGDGNPDGVSVADSASEKAGFHGVTSIQSAAITSKASVLTSLKNGLNAVIVALRAKGIIAS